MSLADAFQIRKFQFNSALIQEFENLHDAKNLWPLVYILSNGVMSQAYVGETTDTFSRMQSHLKHNVKNKLTAVHLITSDKFNKSATLDIEANLIKYISADGVFQLINANLGLAHHNYYQKQEIYWELFKLIWSKLRAEGVAKHPLDYIDNSNLFKYSPYKTLSTEQRHGLQMIMENLLDDQYRNFLIEGGAGTGKTILAIFLFKLINSDIADFNFSEFDEDEQVFVALVKELKRKYRQPKMALVIPMSSFRNTLKKVFCHVKGLKGSMVVGPAEITKEKYDIILVDEAHRLRRRINLGTYFGAFDTACIRLHLDKYSCSELDWVLNQSNKAIFFYDPFQSIKPSDTKKEDFKTLITNKETKVAKLRSQMRVRGGNNYERFLESLLNCSTVKAFSSKEYEFVLFDSIDELISEIKKRDTESGLARLIAGYSWKWVSKKNAKSFDIKIGTTTLRWNRETDDWINSPNAVEEVGCIHTTQGYDLNYAGVIFGNEITYNEVTNEIEIQEYNYYDRYGKQSITDPQVLKDFIVNIYRTILLRGIRGTYVYVCDEKLRRYLARFIPSFRTEQRMKIMPRSKVNPYINSIPLYDLKAVAGGFSETHEVKDADWIELPEGQKPSRELFACTVIGESMNKVIPNGSICLFRRYTGGSRDGRIVLIELIDIQDPDTGSAFTVKEYRSQKKADSGSWTHQKITLKPLSTDPSYLEIVLDQNETNNYKVIGIFEGVLGKMDSLSD